MPSINRFRKGGGTFSALVEKEISGTPAILNAIDFIESSQGLNVHLYPLQRLIVKCVLGVPLDYKEGMIPLYDVFREKLLRTVSERECLHIMHEDGRCNIGDWNDLPYRGFNEACIFAGRRGGKAIALDELIPTPNGFVKNGDIKSGDVVISPSGMPTAVLYAHEPFESEAYRVTFDDGTSVLTHPEHRWFTFTRKERKNRNRRKDKSRVTAVGAGACACGCGEPFVRLAKNRKYRRGHFPRPEIKGSVRTTEEIRATLLARTGGKIQANHSVHLTKAVEFTERNLPLDPYCLGAWLGDGRKIGGNGFTSAEEDAPEMLQQFSSAGFQWKKSRWGQQWNIYGLTPILRKMGLLCNKHIPWEYLWASKTQRLELLRGLMDTDGYCAEDGRVEFCNTSKDLAEGVYHLAASLGLKPFWNEGIARLYGKDCGPKYCVTWTGMLPVFKLARKLARIPKNVKDTQNWRYIVSVEPAGKQMVRCLTVDDPNGLFLFGKNFNVTHNSEVVASIGGYKLYQLLNQKSPQEYFGLVPGSPIDFTFLAQDDDGSNRLYEKLREGVNRAPFFSPYLKASSGSWLGFVTESDRGKRDVTPTVNVESHPCIDENELIWTSVGLSPLKDVAPGNSVLDMHADTRTTEFQTFNYELAWALETRNFRNDPLLLTPKHTCIYVKHSDAISKLPYLYRWNTKKGPKDRLSWRWSNSSGKPRIGNGDFGIKLTEGHTTELSVGDYLVFPQIPEDRRNLTPLGNGESKLQRFEAVANGHAYIRNVAPVPARSVKAFPVNVTACRLYGLYLAEGSVSGSRDPMGTVKWTFHINEKNTLAAFVQQALLSELGLPSTLSEESERNKCSVSCHSVELGRGMTRWFGRGCENKSIPTPALFWDKDCQKALIRGYLDGDGSDNRDIAQTTSRKLAYSLFAISIQAGLMSSVKRKPAYTDKKGLEHAESWIVEICRQERCYRFFQQIDGQNYYWSQISKVENTGEKKRVVDIGVNNTHSFLTKLAAVHNCTTNSVRSPSNVFLALDEFAHFRSEKGSTSDEVYAAATPSTLNFHHAELINGQWVSPEQMRLLSPEGYREFQDSLILSISSPWTKVGKMYDLHRLAMDKGASSDIFTMRVSTAEMNPTVLPKFLHSEYEKNPMTFKAEFGGQFLDSSESYVTEAQIRACTDVQYSNDSIPKPMADTARLNLIAFTPTCVGRRYFWGLDLGMQNDATALAIAHLEHRGGKNPIELVYDYIDRMKVGERFDGPGVFEIPGVEKYKGFKALPIEDILLWLRALNRVMPCFKGATDQHGGQQLVQLLEINQIYNVELLNLTTTINSQMAFALKGYMENTRCRFPFVPKFMDEMRLVEAEFVGKYQIRVQAPAEKGATDDMVDAVQEVAYIAQKWLMEEGGLKNDPTGEGLAIAEQIYKPSKPLISLDGMAMQDLKTLERMRKLQTNLMMSPGTQVVQNPFNRRGGGRRR